MQNHKKCPLCGSQNTVLLFECKDQLVSDEYFPLLRCESCTFVYTNNYPEESEAHRYYKSEEYISHTDSGKGFINKAYHSIRKRMLKKKYDMLRNNTGLKNAAVLDIGSGTGYFPSYLLSKGWNCKGIEISPEARQFALRNKNIKLLTPEEIKEFGNGSIDIITMWHTLEHFYNPDEYLKESYRILKESGIMVIAVPNHLSFDSKKYGSFWAGWDVPRHLWHFNPSSIKIMAGNHNFILSNVHRLPFDSFYVSLLSENHRGSKIALLRGVLFGSISWLISLININRTSSLVYVFRKS